MNEEKVNHPSHYNAGKIEVIDYIEDQQLGFHLGNVVKYISRAGKKDAAKTVEDLEKASWYLDRYIKMLKKNNENLSKETDKEKQIAVKMCPICGGEALVSVDECERCSDKECKNCTIKERYRGIVQCKYCPAYVVSDAKENETEAKNQAISDWNRNYGVYYDYGKDKK